MRTDSVASIDTPRILEGFYFAAIFGVVEPMLVLTLFENALDKRILWFQVADQAQTIFPQLGIHLLQYALQLI